MADKAAKEPTNLDELETVIHLAMKGSSVSGSGIPTKQANLVNLVREFNTAKNYIPETDDFYI